MKRRQSMHTLIFGIIRAHLTTKTRFIGPRDILLEVEASVLACLPLHWDALYLGCTPPLFFLATPLSKLQ